jgi:2-methylcitrate dehydratase PrpD
LFTRTLSRFIGNSIYDNLPRSAIAAAKRGLLDFIGVTFAGAREDVAVFLTGYVRNMKAAGEATVVGGGYCTSASLAAYVNGTMAHALDYDDVIHIPPLWLGHPSVSILPAVLAVAELKGLSGKDIILGYSIGIEIYAKVGLLCGDLPYRKGWHNTSYIGALAAAGAAARLLELDEQQTRRSFGIAASLAGGLRQNFGTMTKPLHAGMAARNGVDAALLAQAGLTASEDIIEAPLGFRNVFTGNPSDLSQQTPDGDGTLTLAEIAARLGNPWNIADPGLSIKICPSCRATHFGMEAALEFRSSAATDWRQLSGVECLVPSHMESVLRYHDPRTGLEGKFSLEYVLARTLRDGVPKIDDFTDDRVNEPEIKDMIRKMRWIPFEPTIGTFGTPQFTFRMGNGQELHFKVDYPRGEPENPVADDVVVAKFHDCAGPARSPGIREEIENLVSQLEDLPSAGALARLLRD